MSNTEQVFAVEVEDCSHDGATPEDLGRETEWTCAECGRVWRVEKTTVQT